ncbi:MAG TPA: DUF177 domain-containing protein [Ferruginibacter sp.]|nr:DUF177 domain-containing protein [Ferruginibacter sp.]
MAAKREFEIAFVGLKQGVHEFNYTVNDKFFIEKGDPDFTNCTANIKLLLDKKSSFMLLKFEIGGKADVHCDRCGNTIDMDIWDEFSMLIKLVENPDEMNAQEEDPDVYYISRTESHIDVANWIYEFVLLSFPLQKLCSPDEMGNPKCNKDVLEKLKSMEAKEEQTNANQLWKGLEQFKKSKKERTKK